MVAPVFVRGSVTNLKLVAQIFIRTGTRNLSRFFNLNLERFYGNHNQYGYDDHQGSFIKNPKEDGALDHFVPAHLSDVSKTLDLVGDE